MVDFFRPVRQPIDPFGTPDTGFATFRVTSPYGTRQDPLGQTATVFHGGLDLGNARLGDDVIASAAGEVIYATNQPKVPWNYAAPPDKRALWGPSYGGNMVVIRHGASGLFTQHAHLNDFAVKLGDKVEATQLLGHVGESGSAHGQGHLHFGIRDRAKLGNGHDGWVDPWPLIQSTGPYEDPQVIADLKADLNRCRNRVVALLAQRDDLKGEITNLEEQLVTLEASVATIPELQTTIRTLRLRVKRLRDKLAAEEAADMEVLP